MKNRAEKLFESVLDFIYPPRCPVCGGWTSGGEAMCSACLEGVKRVQHPICPTCGRPFEAADSDHECGSCITDAPPFDALRSAAFYEGPMREGVLRFKFGGKTALAEPLAETAVGVIEKEYGAIDIDSIIPVPLHPKRLRWRGFNQSLLLARGIGKRAGLWVDAHTLRRIRPTVPQVRLTPKQRLTNVKGAFAVVRPRFVDGREILLVDDVATTCATLMECAKVLKKAGASGVYAVTVARAR